MEEQTLFSTVLEYAFVLIPLTSMILMCWLIGIKGLKLLHLLSRYYHSFLERKTCVAFILFIGLSSFMLLGYRWILETDQIELKYMTMPVSKLVMGEKQFRIIHLSDLHIGDNAFDENRLIRQVNAQQADLICLTGNYLNTQGGEGALRRLLTRFQARYGVVGCEGAWDRKFDIRNIFESSGATFLVDDFLILKGGDGDLIIGGQSLHGREAIGGLSVAKTDQSVVVMLGAYPSGLARESCRDADVYLCGHAYGDQLRLPSLNEFGFSSSFSKPEHVEKAHCQIHISRGISMPRGFLPQMRFSSRPEITVIDLVP